MKTSLLVIFLVSLISWNVFSQKFPLDADAKINYQEIIEVDSVPKDVAYHNGLKWLSTLKDEQVEMISKDSVTGNLRGLSSFFVYSQSGVFKKLSGKISYTISLEVKDNKYRYSISTLVFHYYKQDRTYNMVETGKTKNLEEEDASGWQKLWTRHRNDAHHQLTRNIGQLKQTMTERPTMVTEKTSSKKIEW